MVVSSVAVVLAGGPALLVGGVEVVKRGPSRRQATLALGYLALHRGRTVDADELAEAVWPEGPPGSWPSGLRRILSDVRGWLATAGIEADAIASSHGGYRLDLPDGVEIDVVAADNDLAEAERALRIDDHAGAARAAARALDASRAPLLPGLDAPWIVPVRARWATVHARAAEVLAEAELARGRTDEALDAARRAIDVEPLRESAHRLAMAALAAAGRTGAALRQYEEIRSLLAEELGTRPSPATEEAYLRLLDGGVTTDSGLDAASRSMARLARQRRITQLERTLSELDADLRGRDLERANVLVQLGRTHWEMGGQTESVRRLALAACEAALVARSGKAFGDALGLASTSTGIGIDDPDGALLSQRGLELFGDDVSVRARILSYAAELAEVPRTIDLAAEAVELARKAHDPNLLLDCLLTYEQALAWTPELARRLEVAAEIHELTDMNPDARWRFRPGFEPLTRLQSGDLDGLRDALAHLDGLDRGEDQWEVGFYRLAFRAVLAHVAGSLEEAWALTDRLFAQASDELNALHSYSGLYMVVARDRGGIAELLPAIESVANANPTIPAFRAATAVGHLITGNITEGETSFRLLAEAGLAAAPRDHVWLLYLGLVAEAAARVGGTADREEVLELLDPYAGQVCAGAHGTVVLGLVDALRGLLLASLGRTDEALGSFDAADGLAARMAAPVLAARATAWRGAALAAAGDTEAADAAFMRAIGEAGNIRAPGLVAEIHALSQAGSGITDA